MRTRWAWVVPGAVILAACQSVSSSGDDGDCTSHYEQVAHAHNLSSLKAELRQDVLPSVRSLETVARMDDGKRVVSLLSAKRRIVMLVDVWQETDGSWVAAQWSQCID